VKFALKNGKKAAAREYRTSPSVVRKWIKRYQLEGVTGLKDQSRKPHYSPNKCPMSFEKKVVKIRRLTKHKYGAVRLIERFSLEYGKSCVQRIINDYGLKRKKKTKQSKRNELWSMKKLMRVFEKIQIDVKDLFDIPLYLNCAKAAHLPRYEFTARCVKTGAAFVCYAYHNNSINAATFAIYLLQSLKNDGFDLSTIEAQTDNGAEFNACGQKQKGETPFENAVKNMMGVSLSFIPPASPTFNSDVETFHRLVEDEFYDIEPISSLSDLIAKAYTYTIEFNYLRKNSYKDHKTPLTLALEESPSFNQQLFNLQPIILDHHQNLYFDRLDAPQALITKLTGKPDPLDQDPFLKFFYDPLGLMGDISGITIGGELSLRSSHSAERFVVY